MRAEGAWLVAALLVSSPIDAQEAPPGAAIPPPLLELDRAVELALQTDPGLAASRALEQADRAGLAEARAAARPQVLFGADLGRTDEPVAVFGNLLAQQRFTSEKFALDALNQPDPLSFATARIELSAPLYAGGGLTAGRAAAAALLEAAEADRQRAGQQAAAAAIESYVAASLAHAGLEVAEQALRAAGENHRLGR